MKIIEEKEVKKLYYVEVVHPSRNHVVIPSKMENNNIKSTKDNAVSKLGAVLFTDEEDATLFAVALNTKCKTNVKELGKGLMSEVESKGLIKCKSSLNPYINCYIVNK